MMVAEIAWQQLDERQRQQVGELLKQHPHYQKLLMPGKPADVSEAEWAFVRAAVWPDMVRPARPGSEYETYKPRDITDYHRGYWHYTSIPWQMPATRPSTRSATGPSSRPLTTMRASTRPATQEAARENILTALDANAAALADLHATGKDRAVALAWVEHLVGDVHQPLHAIAMFSADLPDGDHGGNEIVIRAEGAVTRLHSFWDSVMSNSDAYDAVEFLAEDILNDPQLQRAKLHELAERPAFTQWADESYRWATSMSYLNGRLRYAMARDYYDKRINDNDVPPVPPSYYANTRALARRRIALAGYRLAEQVATLLPASSP
jgi:hypothetical protein